MWVGFHVPWLEWGGSRGVNGGGGSTRGGISATDGGARLPSPEAGGGLGVMVRRLMLAGRAGWNDGDDRLRIYREPG
jgi:hypothetical protein